MTEIVLSAVCQSLLVRSVSNFEFLLFQASSDSTKMSTPLLEYLKMKRSSRGRPASAVSTDHENISRVSDWHNPLTELQKWPKGPFTQAIFVAQLDAIFVAPKLHQVSNMFET